MPGSFALAAGEGSSLPPFLQYPVIPHLGELIFGFLVFAIVYFVVRKYFVPRLETMYAERTAAIEGGIAHAEKAQAEAAALLEEYRQLLADARAESSRIREEARAEGATIIAELRQHAQDEAARISAAAQRQLQADRQQALVQLREEVGQLATDLASRIVGESLDDSVRASGVVDRFLAELETAQPAGTVETAGRVS